MSYGWRKSELDIIWQFVGTSDLRMVCIRLIFESNVT